MDLISKHLSKMPEAFVLIAKDICEAQANTIDLLNQEMHYVYNIDEDNEKLEVTLLNEYKTSNSKYISTKVKIFSSSPRNHAAIKVNFLVASDVPTVEAVEIITMRLYEKYYVQKAETRDKTIEIRKRVTR